MTQHHDPVHPDDGDIGDIGAIEALSGHDDAYVTALLAGLPAVVMPADVAARLDAALAEAALTGPTGLTDPEGDLPASAAATVVPITSARSSRWRDPRILKVAAAVVLVLGGGGLAVKAISGSGSSETSTAAGARAPADEAFSYNSAHAYTSDMLATDVRALVAGKLPKSLGSQDSAAGGTATPVATPLAPTTPPGTSDGGKLDAPLQLLTSSVDRLAPCIAAVEADITAVTPYAIDAGTYDGRPALIVVLPNKEDPQSYDVFILGAKCGQGNDADFIAYRRVPRS